MYTFAPMRTFAALALLAISIRAGAQSPAVDMQTVGPPVGSKIPSFTLPDQNGQARTLESLMGPKGAILVFFRSADW
jgi:cytochrome oxidase Cu insertion factor (SCO1/SenC/PrrC family)